MAEPGKAGTPEDYSWEDGSYLHLPCVASWQHSTPFLDTFRGRWDLITRVSLAEGDAWLTDLLDAINDQACDGHRLTWKVMRDRLRHLEDAELREPPRGAAVPAPDALLGHPFRPPALIAKLDSLNAWYTATARAAD